MDVQEARSKLFGLPSVREALGANKVGVDRLYDPNLLEKKIDVSKAGTRYRVLVLIRKRSGPFGLFGWVYFLEQRRKDDPNAGKLYLYGGKIEYQSDQAFEDASAVEAVARETNEEIGLDEGKDFTSGHFDNFIDALCKTEDGYWACVSVYTLQESKARPLTVRRILKKQRLNREKLVGKETELMQAKKANSSPESINKLEREVNRLRGSANAGRPIKVRLFLGVWFRLTVGRPTLNWSKLSPFAAYALLMDRRQQST